jgi:hypothetical protein
MGFWQAVFRRDFWRMSDAELEAEAKRYNVRAEEVIRTYEGRAAGMIVSSSFNRELVIEALTKREAVLSQRISTVLSIGAFLISMVSLYFSVK